MTNNISGEEKANLSKAKYVFFNTIIMIVLALFGLLFIKVQMNLVISFTTTYFAYLVPWFFFVTFGHGIK